MYTVGTLIKCPECDNGIEIEQDYSGECGMCGWTYMPDEIEVRDYMYPDLAKELEKAAKKK